MTGTETTFDRDKLAGWYAARHLKTDPGIRTVYYLPSAAPPREIRFIKVNELIAGGLDTPLEPIDFGIDVGGTDSHTLNVLDATPAQWEAIAAVKLALPRADERTGDRDWAHANGKSDRGVVVIYSYEVVPVGREVSIP